VQGDVHVVRARATSLFGDEDNLATGPGVGRRNEQFEERSIRLRPFGADHPRDPILDAADCLEQVEIAADRGEHRHDPRAEDRIVVPHMVDGGFGQEQVIGEAIPCVEKPAGRPRLGTVDDKLIDTLRSSEATLTPLCGFDITSKPFDGSADIGMIRPPFRAITIEIEEVLRDFEVLSSRLSYLAPQLAWSSIFPRIDLIGDPALHLALASACPALVTMIDVVLADRAIH
jgi:hypothetical protein